MMHEHRQTRPVVLIVEDETGPRNALTVILRPFYELITVGSSQDALQILRERPIDLVTLDTKLPDGSGIELLRSIKREFPRIEVVVITGYGKLKSSHDALRHGAAGYLLKPFNVRELITLLQHTVAKQQRLDLLRNWLHEHGPVLTDARLASDAWAQLGTMGQALPPAGEQFEAYQPLLADLLESADRERLAHANRVRGYALLMAPPLHLSPQDTQSLSIGAFLHDIGTLITPDDAAHPDTGARMVLPFRTSDDVRQIILAHHECVDGSGFPRGLTDEQITPLAKMVGIAQAFDHLTAPGPDALFMSVDVAGDQLLAQAGRKLDRRLTELFVGHITEAREFLPASARH
jgi:response regulator RpfG family c-di-GMP phosphodiesterase